jgi:hypothetical protein
MYDGNRVTVLEVMIGDEVGGDGAAKAVKSFRYRIML